ncbi:centrosomal protein POC5-like [Lingula anatina]|uniref:Centrosomal protein POC5 n=1 Tax=Lingula anatina TaxID=7574 RepID=A0A1S3HN68_LINAN|nr:centrosomal protein POC5-like [Lingula anatina]|eukprot:XP_013387505.1 centrosomal protein POC5-like [Lingula anatina]
MSSTSDDSSTPMLPEDSPGSSISSRLQDEYDELLKYAVVVPKFDPSTLPQTLADIRESFPQRREMPTIPERHVTISAEESSPGESVEEEERIEDRNSSSQTGRAQQPYVDPSQQGQRAPSRSHVSAQLQTPSKMAGLGGQAPLTPESESSTLSASPGEGSPESQPAYSPTVDPDVGRMEQYLDVWCGDLKRNVLNELSRMKIKTIEHGRQQLQREKEKHALEVNQLQNEMEGLKELLNTYEQSIQRKDEVISNLTRGLQKQREKFEMLKTFCDWKIRHSEQMREKFATNLARKHYHRTLSQKVWASWHAIIEAKWRQRVEKACQAKAQEVCIALTNDYETKLASLNEALDAARTEVGQLHAEREKYEETMKKAFMRGVCALNLEAMSMFHEGEDGNGQGDGQSDGGSPGDGGSGGGGMVIPQEPVYSTESQQRLPSHLTSTSAPAQPRVVTSQAALSHSYVAQTARPQMSKQVRPTSSLKGKTVTATVSARPDVLRRGDRIGGEIPTMGLAPPMSSVLVERHQPVVKQTIGHATAMQYPRSGQPLQRPGPTQPRIVQRKIAGQTGPVHLGSPNVHTVKVV